MGRNLEDRMSEDTGARVPTIDSGKITIMSMRWDGLGARLATILNAISLAQALGVEYSIVWPATE